MADSLQAGSVRVGAADRTLVAERLVAHYQAGRLPRQELELRLTRVAHARTDDDLHRLTIDLPDVPGPARPISLVPRTSEPTPAPSSLRIAVDVAVMLVTFSAAVCLALLLIVASTTSSGYGTTRQTFDVAALAAVGALIVGAGTVHLLYRAFGKR